MFQSLISPLLTVSVVLAVTIVGCGNVPRNTSAGLEGEIRLPEQPYEDHIQLGDPHPEYNSKPAVSGWHSGFTVEWGFHDYEIPDEVLVHNLEHGGVGIHYDCPDGCSSVIQSLRMVSERYDKVVVSPYPGLDSVIVLTAWTYIDKLNQFDEVRITKFIETHMSSPVAPEYLVDVKNP